MDQRPTEFDRIRDIAAQQNGLVRSTQLKACGVGDAEIRRHLRHGRLMRAFALHGVYLVPALAPRRASLLLRAQAVQLAMGPEAVIAGHTAAILWGMQGTPAEDRDIIVVALPNAPSRRGTPGVQVARGAVAPGEITFKDGVRVTTPERTLRDSVLETDRETAVSLMDSAINLGLVGAERLPELQSANKGRKRQRCTAHWWGLADGRAQSPLETRIRLLCGDAGIPPDALQRPLALPGGHTVFGDLWWDSGPLLVEADGAGSHAGPSGIFRDQHRQNALLAAHPGLKLLRFSWKDLSSPGAVVSTIAAALARP